MASFWALLRLQRPCGWAAAAAEHASKQSLSAKCVSKGLLLGPSKPAGGGDLLFSSFLESVHSRGIHGSAFVEARDGAARKEVEAGWNPLLTLDPGEMSGLREGVDELRRAWRKASRLLEPEGAFGVSRQANRAVRKKESYSESGGKEAGDTRSNAEAGKVMSGKRELVEERTSTANVQKGSHRMKGASPAVAAPSKWKEMAAAQPSKHKMDAHPKQVKLGKDRAQGWNDAGAAKSEKKRDVSAAKKPAFSAAKKPVVSAAKGPKWDRPLARVSRHGQRGFGVHETKESAFDGRFTVRQGAAITGTRWLELAPDAEFALGPSAANSSSKDAEKPVEDGMAERAAEGEAFGFGQSASAGFSGRRKAGGGNEGHSKVGKDLGGAESEGGVSHDNRAFESGAREDDRQGAAAAMIGPGTGSDGQSLMTRAGVVQQDIDSDEVKSSLDSDYQLPVDDAKAPSTGAPNANIELGHSDEGARVAESSSDSQIPSSSRDSGNSSQEPISVQQLHSRQEKVPAASAETERPTSETPTSEAQRLYNLGLTSFIGEEAQASDELQTDDAEPVPDLEELRTWLAQLDRQGSEDEDEEEGQLAASVPVEKQKSLRLAIMGPPNAGKSVLTNALVGSKVSAVSAKTNTTRAAIIGVSTHRSTQLVICDTPGLASLAPGRDLRNTNKQLVNRARRAGADCDVVVVIIDAAREIERPDPRIPRMVAKLGDHLPDAQKHALVLNKVDMVRRQDRLKLEELQARLMELHAFDRCFVTSGKRGLGLKQLHRYLRKSAVARPWELPEGRPTDLTDEQRAMDIVRQHLLDRLHKEIPYKVVVKPVSWEERGDGGLEIRQDLVVDRKKIKAMVVGRGGATIKQITLGAREELGQILDRRIELLLNVRVQGM